MSVSDVIHWLPDLKSVWLVQGFGWLLLLGFFFALCEDLKHAESRRQRSRAVVAIVALAVVATHLADWLYADAALLADYQADRVRALSHIGLFFGILVAVLGVARIAGWLAELLGDAFRTVERVEQ